MQTFKRGLVGLVIILCLIFSIQPALALIIGFGFRHFLGEGSFRGISNSYKWLLQLTIVLLGFCLNVNQALSVGREVFLLTSISVIAVVLVGWLFSKFFLVNKKLSLLIFSGTAICGGSAIASVSPIIHASSNETSSALAVVFLLNSLAIFVFPPLGHLFQMNDIQYGLWCAVAIHDTSSVIGAASAYGQEALELAATTKVVRALWILPLMLVLSFRKNKRGEFKLPWFILLFVGAVIFASVFQGMDRFMDLAFQISKSLMSLVLFLMGSTITIKEFKLMGYKPLAFGTLLWAFITIASAMFIYNYK